MCKRSISCHICQKNVRHIRPHLKNTHKWSKEQLRVWKKDTKYEVVQRRCEESGSNTALWESGFVSEAQMKENRKKIVILDEASKAMKSIVSHTENVFTELHEKMERELILDGDSIGGASNGVRSALTPSWEYINQMLNLELFRLTSNLTTAHVIV